MGEKKENKKESFLERLHRSLGPILGGLLLDFADLATFGPLGIYGGFFFGAIIGLWLSSLYGFGWRGKLFWAVVGAAYCFIPGTEIFPIATILGACARFQSASQDPTDVALQTVTSDQLFSSANISDAIPGELPDELVEVLAASDTVRIERIVSRGHASPEDFWYDQELHEFVILIEGEAIISFEDDRADVRLASGDYLTIPAHLKHRVLSTASDTNTVWLAVHYK